MTQPSGWYDDPSDPSSLRYWDGILWTDRTVPKTSPTAGASTIGHAVDPYAASSHPAPSGPGLAPYPPGQPTPYGQPPAGRDYGAAPTYQWRPAGPTTPDGVPLAQWWQRLVAALIDGVVLTVIGFALSFPWLRDFFVWYVDFLEKTASGPAATDLTVVFSDIAEQMAGYLVPITLIQATVALVYHVAFLSRNGASLGKMALSIRVRRTGRPGPLTLLEATRRQALQFALTLIGLVPIIGSVLGLVSSLDQAWLLWDPRRQCLHDKIADTVVEQKPPRSHVQQPPRS